MAVVDPKTGKLYATASDMSMSAVDGIDRSIGQSSPATPPVESGRPAESAPLQLSSAPYGIDPSTGQPFMSRAAAMGNAPAAPVSEAPPTRTRDPLAGSPSWERSRSGDRHARSEPSAPPPPAKVDPGSVKLVGAGGEAGADLQSRGQRGESESSRIARQALESELGRKPGKSARIPAKDVRTSFQKRPGLELTDDEQALLEGTSPIADKERRDQANEEAAAARLEGREVERAALLTEQQRLDQEEQRIQDMRAESASMRERIEKLQNEADSAEVGTRDAVWGNMGAFAKIGAGLAMIGGGARAGLAGGGPNQGTAVIMKIIDDDIAGMNEIRASKQDSANRARRDYADALERWGGDPEKAQMDLRMRKLQNASAVARSYAADGEDAQWKANLDQASQDLAMKAAEERAKLQARADGEIVENWTYQPERVVGGGGTDVYAAARKAAALKKDLATIMGEDVDPEVLDRTAARTVRAPDGGLYLAKDPETASKAQADYAARLEFIAKGNDYARLLRDPKTRVDGTAERNSAERSAAELLMTANAAAKAGALDDGTVKILQEIVASPDRFGSSALERIESAVKSQQGSASRIPAAYGMVPLN
jgi:hypothetical protein